MQGIKGVGRDGAEHGVNTARELIADCGERNGGEEAEGEVNNELLVNVTGGIIKPEELSFVKRNLC